MQRLLRQLVGLQRHHGSSVLLLGAGGWQLRLAGHCQLGGPRGGNGKLATGHEGGRVLCSQASCGAHQVHERCHAGAASAALPALHHSPPTAGDEGPQGLHCWVQRPHPWQPPHSAQAHALHQRQGAARWPLGARSQGGWRGQQHASGEGCWPLQHEGRGAPAKAGGAPRNGQRAGPPLLEHLCALRGWGGQVGALAHVHLGVGPLAGVAAIHWAGRVGAGGAQGPSSSSRGVAHDDVPVVLLSERQAGCHHALLCSAPHSCQAPSLPGCGSHASLNVTPQPPSLPRVGLCWVHLPLALDAGLLQGQRQARCASASVEVWQHIGGQPSAQQGGGVHWAQQLPRALLIQGLADGGIVQALGHSHHGHCAQVVGQGSAHKGAASSHCGVSALPEGVRVGLDGSAVGLCSARQGWRGVRHAQLWHCSCQQGSLVGQGLLHSLLNGRHAPSIALEGSAEALVVPARPRQLRLQHLHLPCHHAPLALQLPHLPRLARLLRAQRQGHV